MVGGPAMSARKEGGGAARPSGGGDIYSYRPIRKMVTDPALVAEVLEFCRPLAAAVHPENADQARHLMGALFLISQWARQRGMQMKASVVLHPQNVRKWILSENQNRKHSWQKGSLRWIRKAAVASGVDGWAQNRIVLPRGGPAPPYDAQQEESYRQQASQKYRPNRQEWMLIAAGSLGFGLSGREIQQIRRDDLEDMGGGRVAVRVGGRNPRLVPGRKLWTPTALLAAEAADGDSDGGPLITAVGAHHVYDIAKKFTARDRGGLSLPRARSTWLAAHLRAGTPLPALRKIAGPVSADTLNALLAHAADDLDDDTAARQAMGP